MKKIVSLLLALCLTLCCTAALAAGKLEVTQEAYYAVESYSSYIGYLFAEVTNTGDSNVEFGSGVMEILSESGDVTDTDEIYSCYPSVLAPGQKGYIVNHTYTDATQLSDIADHTLTVVGKTSKEETAAQLDVTEAKAEKYEQWDTTYYRIVVTITNNTEETVYDANVVAGVCDADGNLLYVGTDTLYNLGIPAGSTMEVRIDMDNDMVEKWLADGTEPAAAEAVCFVSGY